MIIKCPFCNKLLTLSDDMIIPMTGICPNCGEVNVFNNIPKISFPNKTYDENGNLVEDDKIEDNDEVKKIAQEMLKTIEEMKSGE